MKEQMSFAAAWRPLSRPGLHSAAGQYAAASDSVACDPCLPGRDAGAGATGCTECPVGQTYFTGYFTAAAGGACVECPLGQFTAEVRLHLV